MTPSEQARADAMADAETLRAFQRDPYPPNFLIRTFAPNAYATECGALRCGVDASLWARGHFYETERALVDDATHVARAAFRAVPGLRGEDTSTHQAGYPDPYAAWLARAATGLRGGR